MWEWMDYSACREYDPDLWFIRRENAKPGGDPRAAAVARREADYLHERLKRVCQSCPVVEECFWDAMLRPDKYAMRAGLSPNQQARMRHKYPKAIEARRALLSRVA